MIQLKQFRHFFILFAVVILGGFVGCKDQMERMEVTPEISGAAPTVTMFTPTAGGKSTELSLYGTNFGRDLSNISVTINGVEAEVKNSTGNILTVVVKKGSGSGPIKVFVGSGSNKVELAYQYSFNYTTSPIVSTAMGPSSQGNSIEGKINSSYSESTFSKPIYLAFNGNSLYIVEEKTESGGTYTFAPTIRMAADNQLSTVLDGRVALLTIDRPRAVAFSLDGNTMYIGNDKNGPGPISFGKMTKGASGFENAVNIWDGESVTAVGVHPTTGDVFFVGYSNDSWIYKYNPTTGTVIKAAQLTATDGGVVVKKPSASSIVFDKHSNDVYILAKGKHIIFKGQYDPSSGALTGMHILAGQEGIGGYADAEGTSALFNEPWQGDIGSDGNLYVADRKNHRIRKVTPDGIVTTYAGTGASGQSDGLLTGASFNHPQGLAFGPDGAMYIADYWNHRIRKIEAE